jgi:hypothetical protein
MIQYPLIVIFGKVEFEPAASLQLPRLAAAGGGRVMMMRGETGIKTLFSATNQFHVQALCLVS